MHGNTRCIYWKDDILKPNKILNLTAASYNDLVTILSLNRSTTLIVQYWVNILTQGCRYNGSSPPGRSLTPRT